MDVDQVAVELKAIKRLLGLLVTAECKGKQEKVGLLSDYGFSTGEIAEILGMTSKYASAVLSNLRKKGEQCKTTNTGFSPNSDVTPDC